MGKETKSFLVWLAASAAIMLALPGLIVTLVNSGSGMAVCLLLFFAINPAYAVPVGIFSGKNVKRRWSLPVAAAVLFLLGAWLCFGWGETAFLWYAGVYLVLGAGAMLASCWYGYKKANEREPGGKG